MGTSTTMGNEYRQPARFCWRSITANCGPGRGVAHSSRHPTKSNLHHPRRSGHACCSCASRSGVCTIKHFCKYQATGGWQCAKHAIGLQFRAMIYPCYTVVKRMACAQEMLPSGSSIAADSGILLLHALEHVGQQNKLGDYAGGHGHEQNSQATILWYAVVASFGDQMSAMSPLGTPHWRCPVSTCHRAGRPPTQWD